jgi:pimeloyl-ACP methyl ester carboxylesterase
MDVRREPLEVLARICDVRLGKECPEPGPAVARDRDCRVHTLHFGPGKSLYGIVTSPAAARADEAVLVCGPVGQENTRASFVLRSFAKRLAAAGIASMQFDYFGTGDSLGEGVQATCSRWRGDIIAALTELVERTGAKRVTAVGARLGATLLAQVAGEINVARFVLWDPVTSGAAHLSEMQRMQRDYLRTAERFTFRKRRPARGTELLGSTYSSQALTELRSLGLPGAAPRVPVKWLVTSPPRRACAAFERLAGKHPGSRLSLLDVDCEWQTLSRLEDMLPDVGIAAALATLCTEAS